MAHTILVIEDDFDTLNPLAELLRLKGHTVSTASDAEMGLRMAQDRRPELIITDIVLPGKSGLQFISAVRKDNSIGSIPIIVISGCGPMVLVEAERAGADICLEKPIRIDSFWAAIDHVFENPDRAEPPATVTRGAAEAGTPASEIDALVNELRLSSSTGEREDVLRRLKQHILGLQKVKQIGREG